MSISRNRLSSFSALSDDFNNENNLKLIPFADKIKTKRFHRKETLEGWRTQFSFPWSAIIDLLIVLFYVYFSMTYQATKMDNYQNFNTIFDTFFVGEDNEDSNGANRRQLLYFQSDVIDRVNDSLVKAFDFPDHFPTQDYFNITETIPVTLTYNNQSTEIIEVSVEDIDDIVDYIDTNFDEISTIYILITYSIISDTFNTTLEYSMYSHEIENLGFVEFKYTLEGTIIEHDEEDDNPLSIRKLPILICILDSIAIIMTLYRMFRSVYQAIYYLRTHYVTDKRTVWSHFSAIELFSLVCQVCTLVSFIAFINVVDIDFGEHPWLLRLLALSALMHSLSLMRYMHLKEELWLVAKLLYTSLGKAFYVIIGFFPVCFGYVFIGLALFGHFSYLFKGFLRTMKILNSMMHTDVCMDTHTALMVEAVEPKWEIVIYICTWLALNGGIMLNVILTIVEDVLSELTEHKE